MVFSGFDINKSLDMLFEKAKDLAKELAAAIIPFASDVLKLVDAFKLTSSCGF